MNKWSAPQRPAIYAEQMLLTSIIEGDYPPGSTLPSERELACSLASPAPPCARPCACLKVMAG